MSDDSDFADFLRRVRAGDPRAAEELARRYEPVIKREVRLKLYDPSLKRFLDSGDICQSVLASFFIRAAAGQYDLAKPLQLLRLLIRMAQKKVAMAARRQHAQRRDGRRVERVGVEDLDPATVAPSPSRVIAMRELLNQVRERLTDEERQLAEQRTQGLEWAAVAAKVGGTADGRRMQLTRALDRIARELGLEGGLS